MERKRGREMNPPSADPPSATPVARANLPGSVAAAFNGTYLHAVAARCHLRVLSCLIPYSRVCTRVLASVPIGHALAFVVHKCHLLQGYNKSSNLKTNVFILGFSPFCNFPSRVILSSSHHHSLILIRIIRSRRFDPGHVHWVQHQEAGQRALQNCRLHQ
jgi:hypothetical protein